ncbi:hypothetical protein EVAR_50222_1 [Eumeta japonica]|uniref:Uncharacterized protein n=1 Tax=Eumeta variegata TaxID=151549 RepID=A0A4C1X0H3_EUMVA|nr:hypothetical protein EVAR_50222_1 [Eumeta japonica]
MGMGMGIEVEERAGNRTKLRLKLSMQLTLQSREVPGSELRMGLRLRLITSLINRKDEEINFIGIHLVEVAELWSGTKISTKIGDEFEWELESRFEIKDRLINGTENRNSIKFKIESRIRTENGTGTRSEAAVLIFNLRIIANNKALTARREPCRDVFVASPPSLASPCR